MWFNKLKRFKLEGYIMGVAAKSLLLFILWGGVSAIIF